MNFIAAYQLALAGQEEGYRFLYDSTCQTIYDYILQNVDGKDTADRLIGKVYETAWAGLGGLSDPNAFPGWVQGIAESAVMWEKKNPAVSSAGASPMSGLGTGSGTGGMNITPGVSPNIAQAASPNAANIASPNVANASSLSAEHMVAAGGKSAVSGISAGAKAATGAKVAAGTKAAFLSTAAGKAVLGIGCTVAAAALTTGGYFAAKNLTKDEPDTTSTEISSAVIETNEDTEIASDTESMATEATEEITATEEMTTTEEASTEAVTEQSTTVAEFHDIPVAELPEQEAWIHFMGCLECIGDITDGYDCKTVINGSRDLFNMLLGSVHCIDYSQYDILQSVNSWGSKSGGTDDPRGYLNTPEWENSGFNSVSVEGLKWVATNILNIPEDDYDKLSETFVRDSCYIEDGRYYSFVGGIGWEGLEYEIKSVRTDGTMYYITYDGVPAYYGLDEATMKAGTRTYEAKMELKEFDGKKYWSIYSFHLVE